MTYCETVLKFSGTEPIHTLSATDCACGAVLTTLAGTSQGLLRQLGSLEAVRDFVSA